MEIRNEDLCMLSRRAEVAISTFVACRHPVESCRHNGLPLTPNSISILGQAQRLKHLRHDNLCSFLECQRGKGERIVCVSEFYGRSLHDHQLDGDYGFLLTTGRQILRALAYLEAESVFHTNLEAKNVLLTAEGGGGGGGGGGAKLHDYGLGHMTNYGLHVSFPVFANPRTTAPEVFGSDEDPNRSSLRSQPSLDPDAVDSDQDQDSIVFIESTAPAPPRHCTSKCSVWSLGILLLTKALEMDELWPNLNVAQTIRKVLAVASSCSNKSAADRIVKEHNLTEKFLSLPPELRSLIEECLVVDPLARRSPKRLLADVLNDPVPDSYEKPFEFPVLRLRSKGLDLKDLKMLEAAAPADEQHPESVESLTIREVLYLWQLAGGDFHSELRKHGLVVTMPPILNLPTLAVSRSSSSHHRLVGQSKDKSSLYDPSVVSLDLGQLIRCLETLTVDDIHPVLWSAGGGGGSGFFGGDDSLSEETSSLPIVIREKDVRYQFGRIVLYRRMLQAYPYQRTSIWREARVDSLPLYRSYIWAALLGVENDVQAAYDAIDKEAWTPTDRQIEVDIPRCHQYNHLLASPEGHRKFKRVLKAWVVTNKQYVYWQGLDSLCAPFLLLNFNNEALAFACLSAFIPKYLYGMFRKDNSNVIQEYLAKFSHVQAFHDPVLFNHLDGIGFIPDLYAIPWVLTMFSHVFPLHNIFHLWDKLLLGNSAFPLCVALAILYQLRDRLLTSEFNDCILLFSDLPTIDIEKCVKDSIHIFCSTPKSLTFRKFGCPAGSGTSKPPHRHDDLSYDREDLTLGSVSLAQQKAEKVPRISGEEALVLIGLAKVLVKQSDEAGAAEIKTIKSKMIVVDVRQPAEFKLGALPESVNFPFSRDEPAPPNLAKTVEERLPKASRKVVCVVGSRQHQESAVRFASLLVTEVNMSRVCVLHNGIEIFKPLPGVLFVPNV